MLSIFLVPCLYKLPTIVLLLKKSFFLCFWHFPRYEACLAIMGFTCVVVACSLMIMREVNSILLLLGYVEYFFVSFASVVPLM